MLLPPYKSRRGGSLPGLCLFTSTEFLLDVLMGVLLPTTLAHFQLHQKCLTRPTCVNNQEHSTILFSYARCCAMCREFRSVGAWSISNTLYRPLLRVGDLCVLCCLTDWKDTVRRVCMDKVAGLPVKPSLRQFHRCMELSSW